MVYDPAEITKHNHLFSTNTFRVGDRVNRNILVNCDHGLMIVNRFDSNPGKVGHAQWLLDHGNVSTVEALICHESIKDLEAPVIFDVGANIGTFTTWLSKAFPHGKVYSFEPQRPIFQMLCGNIAVNNIYNAHIYNIGLGLENKFIEINEPDYFQNVDYGTFTLHIDTHVDRTIDKLVVEIKTLDTFVEQFKVPRVDLIKIDVEGMDLDVLYGSEASIKKYRPKVFIEYANNESNIQDKIKEFLSPFGYEFNVIGNNILCY